MKCSAAAAWRRRGKGMKTIQLKNKLNIQTEMRNLRNFIGVAALAALALTGCGSNKQASETTLSGLDPAKFDSTIDGQKTALYTLKNAAGMEVCITNFGGRIVSIMVPDKNGEMKDVVLGFDNVYNYADAEHTPSDFGACIGRYANRIDQGKFTLEGQTYQLPQNDGKNCLHGGPKGWQYAVYTGAQTSDSTLELTLTSKDGDMNFPGTVTAKVTYTLTADNAIDIKYEATTDKPTVINMTNHSYFNLNGDPDQPITNCKLYVNADNFTPINETFIPLGQIVPVKTQPEVDFTTPTEVGKNVDNFACDQIKKANGFDFNWVLNTYKDGKGDDTTPAASVVSPTTGIKLEVFTNEPGLQIYTGNFLDGKVTGKNGKTYNKHAAICLESQHFPNTPNQPEWPTAELKPGETYQSHCIFKFSVEK